ncbi:type I-E CRISPR-associated protein Cse2/CasB [Bowmanella dokdonensis]|uniref:Type I-E CRISPR-associated protein Cse2/CasB n=1 Tax=Bowmanella dokdonensis TaxID=751969 RepID=A0A939DPP5_9ALTE|nr:type I-E CRISPR-associated protein Cse2/CasB [Bowmanella dokdonensis]MBN7826492.1 type I-E CRISPR-associated protein Cse2/CasB [Bowmanella dokdonensis]
MSDKPIYASHSLLRQQATRLALLNWWEALSLSPEELKRKKRQAAPSRWRAELRRCNSPDALLLTEGFRALWQALPEPVRSNASDHHVLAWACIVGALAYVESQSDTSFATSLGQIKDNSDKSVVSELRFQALQQAKDPDELYRRVRRLVKQIKGKVSVLSLADDILCWFDEHHYPRPTSASNKLAVRWAMDYYKASSTTR